MGQVPGPVLLVQNVDDVAALRCPRTHRRLYHPDHAERRRHQGHHCRLQQRFTDIQGPDIRDICYATQNANLR